MKKILILGNGVYANAIAKNIKTDNTIIKIFDPVTDDYEEIKEYNIIFILVGSKYMEDVLYRLSLYNLNNKTIYTGSKGLIDKDTITYSSYIKNNLKVKKHGYFAGPSFAKDLETNCYTSFTIASKNIKVRKLFKELFKENIHVNEYKYEDVLELQSTLKNIYAIGSGIIYSMYPNSSTLASFISMAYSEEIMLLKDLFHSKEYSYQKDHLGDFYMTSAAMQSRNFTLGSLISKNKEKALKYLEENTCEGYENLTIIAKYLDKELKNYKILNLIYEITFKNKEPKEILNIYKN